MLSDREGQESRFPRVFSLDLPKKGILEKLGWKHGVHKEFPYSAGGLKKQSAPETRGW